MPTLILALCLAAPEKPVDAKVYASALAQLGVVRTATQRLDCVPMLYETIAGKAQNLPDGTRSCRVGVPGAPDSQARTVKVTPAKFAAALKLLGYDPKKRLRLDCTPDPYCSVVEVP